MRMAVQSGDAKAVDDLMEHLNDTLAVDELTTTYGGDYGLVRQTDTTCLRVLPPFSMRREVETWLYSGPS